MAQQRRVLQRCDPFDDSLVKNKWKWVWMEAEIEVEEGVKERLGKHLRKLCKSGLALCAICDSEVVYGSKGRIALEAHLRTTQHRKAVKSLVGNFSISGQPLRERQAYGAHPMFAATTVKTEATRATPLVPLDDRTQNAEAMVISFVAENNMSLASVPKIIQLAKALANDKRALDNMASSNATASYKLRHGVAATFQAELVEELKTTPFSLNLDEAMNSNSQKVVTVLVSHFCESQQAVVVNHLASFSLTKITSENLYQALDEVFSNLQLPWTNVVSVLMDSCNVMRGDKSGLETLIRQKKAPQLLDVDGDTCHHAHNAAKQFCLPFGRHVEGLLNDLHTDHKWSTYTRELFQKICLALQLKPSAPKKYVAHRWLSLVEIVADTLRLKDALMLFYHAFLSSSDKELYREEVQKIFSARGVTSATCLAIKKVQANANATLKSSTNDGKDRKKRICDKLFVHMKKTFLHLDLYMSALTVLHKYIKIFQTRQPMMHKLHDHQEELLKDFLSCFVRPEKLEGGLRQLRKLNLDDSSIILPPDLIVLGQYASQHVMKDKKPHPVKQEFILQAKKAYIQGGKKLLASMPLANKVLRCFSCLDPKTKGTTAALRELSKLPDLLPFFTEEEKRVYSSELRGFQVDRTITPMKDDARIDSWWASLDSQKYPTLKKAAKAALSCFHGPLVESAFSVMGEVIDKSTTNMDMETYSSIQTVKNALAACGKTSVEYFSKADPLKDPVNRLLIRNMLTAAKKDKDRLLKNAESRRAEAESLGVEPKKLTSKRKATEEVFENAKRARLDKLTRVDKSRQNTAVASQDSALQTGVDKTRQTTAVEVTHEVEKEKQAKKIKQTSVMSFFSKT